MSGGMVKGVIEVKEVNGVHGVKEEKEEWRKDEMGYKQLEIVIYG